MGDQQKPFEILELVDSYAGLRHSFLARQQIAQFPIGRDHNGSRAIALPAAELAALHKLLPQGLIIDCAAKHRARALSTYFAGRTGLLAVLAARIDHPALIQGEPGDAREPPSFHHPASPWPTGAKSMSRWSAP